MNEDELFLKAIADLHFPDQRLLKQALDVQREFLHSLQSVDNLTQDSLARLISLSRDVFKHAGNFFALMMGKADQLNPNFIEKVTQYMLFKSSELARATSALLTKSALKPDLVCEFYEVRAQFLKSILKKLIAHDDFKKSTVTATVSAMFCNVFGTVAHFSIRANQMETALYAANRVLEWLPYTLVNLKIPCHTTVTSNLYKQAFSVDLATNAKHIRSTIDLVLFRNSWAKGQKKKSLSLLKKSLGSALILDVPLMAAVNEVIQHFRLQGDSIKELAWCRDLIKYLEAKLSVQLTNEALAMYRDRLHQVYRQVADILAQMQTHLSSMLKENFPNGYQIELIGESVTVNFGKALKLSHHYREDLAKKYQRKGLSFALTNESCVIDTYTKHKPQLLLEFLKDVTNLLDHGEQARRLNVSPEIALLTPVTHGLQLRTPNAEEMVVTKTEKLKTRPLAAVSVDLNDDDEEEEVQLEKLTMTMMGFSLKKDEQNKEEEDSEIFAIHRQGVFPKGIYFVRAMRDDVGQQFSDPNERMRHERIICEAKASARKCKGLHIVSPIESGLKNGLVMKTWDSGCNERVWCYEDQRHTDANGQTLVLLVPKKVVKHKH